MLKTFALPALAAGIVLVTFVASASAQTLGDSLNSGRLSGAAFQQLIAGTGLSPVEARSLTLEDVVAIKWQDD